MPQSLSSKLRCLRRKLKPRFLSHQLLDMDNIKAIARHMPRTSEDLGKLIPHSFVAAYGDEILEVTIHHERDQAKFEDCVSEIGSFLRGGLPGMARLDRVYLQILKHFELESDVEEVLDACKIYIHPEQNCLKRKRPIVAEEEDLDSHHFSQM